MIQLWRHIQYFPLPNKILQIRTLITFETFLLRNWEINKKNINLTWGFYNAPTAMTYEFPMIMKKKKTHYVVFVIRVYFISGNKKYNISYEARLVTNQKYWVCVNRAMCIIYTVTFHRFIIFIWRFALLIVAW